MSKKSSIRKILAIIPARGGSKGIPRKNIYPIAGKPLLAWTVEAARGAKSIDRVVVSSDDPEILEIAQKYGAEPVKRPKKIAGDNSPFNLLIFHALDQLKKRDGYVPDVIAYLQPTSPLRNSLDIDKALSLMRSGANGVISVCEADRKILKCFLAGREGYLMGVSDENYPFLNRQDLPEVYMPNGAIYAIRSGIFLKTGRLMSNKSLPFIMDKKKALDVDSLEDLKLVEEVLKKNRI